MSGADSPILLTGALVSPLLLLWACVFRPVRARILDLLALAPLPALAASLLARGGASAVLDLPRLRLTAALDRPGAMLLGTSALLWIAAGAYASAYLRGQPDGMRFAAFWLLTMTGSLGVFFAADLVSFYVIFALVSLAAVVLVAHDGTPRARNAAIVYINLAVLGEALLLAGFVLMAAAMPGDSLLISDAVAVLPGMASRDVALAFLVGGFGLKAGLVPLHVWLPVAHPAAPMPASAVLSGAIIKAGIIGLIRFLPFGGGMPEWGVVLTVVGLFTAFYGVAIGITQASPKTVLAYSSVSQMGLVAVVLGQLLRAGEGADMMGVAFYAAHHVLAKGALFLAVGVIAATGARKQWPVLLLTGFVALGFGGLPLTGGALAKLAVKAPLGSGAVGSLATVAAVGSTVLMLHFSRRLALAASANPEARPPAGLAAPWLAMAVAAIVVPWTLDATAGIGDFADALAPSVLWASLWPVLVGVVLAIPLARWGGNLPRVPEGDIVVLGATTLRMALAAGAAMERLDRLLALWPVAGLLLLTLAIGLGVAMMAAP